MDKKSEYYIMINLIKSIALLTGLQGSKFLGAASCIVKKNVSQLIDRNA